MVLQSLFHKTLYGCENASMTITYRYLSFLFKNLSTLSKSLQTIQMHLYSVILYSQLLNIMFIMHCNNLFDLPVL